MAAELNELFEEGITRCGELTDAVDEALDAVDRAAEQARDVAERVEDEGREARERLGTLVALLETAEGAIGAAREDAGGALEGLTARASALTTGVGTLLDRVRRAVSQIQELRGRVSDSLDAQMETSRGDLAELAEKTQELESVASQRLEEAGRAIVGFRATVDGARTELAQKQEDWSAALDRLEGGAQEQASACVAGLQSLLKRQATAMVSAANVMVDRHNDAMEAIKHEFAQEAPQELTSALEPLQAALRGLAEEAAAREEALGIQVAELEAAMGAQAPALEGLRAALEAAAVLGE